MEYYLIIIAVYVVVALIFAAIITNSGSNYKLKGSFAYYFFLSFLFTPFIAILFAILDALTLSAKKVEKSQEQEKKPAKLEGNKIWIANEKDKRITIFESELEDYLADGWHVVK